MSHPETVLPLVATDAALCVFSPCSAMRKSIRGRCEMIIITDPSTTLRASVSSCLANTSQKLAVQVPKTGNCWAAYGLCHGGSKRSLAKLWAIHEHILSFSISTGAVLVYRLRTACTPAAKRYR